MRVTQALFGLISLALAVQANIAAPSNGESIQQFPKSSKGRPAQDSSSKDLPRPFSKSGKDDRPAWPAPREDDRRPSNDPRDERDPRDGRDNWDRAPAPAQDNRRPEPRPSRPAPQLEPRPSRPEPRPEPPRTSREDEARGAINDTRGSPTPIEECPRSKRCGRSEICVPDPKKRDAYLCVSGANLCGRGRTCRGREVCLADPRAGWYVSL